MKVIKGSSGQLLVTIPKALADGMEVKAGDIVTWKILGKGRLELTKDRIE